MPDRAHHIRAWALIASIAVSAGGIFSFVWLNPQLYIKVVTALGGAAIVGGVIMLAYSATARRDG